MTSRRVSEGIKNRSEMAERGRSQVFIFFFFRQFFDFSRPLLPNIRADRAPAWLQISQLSTSATLRQKNDMSLNLRRICRSREHFQVLNLASDGTCGAALQ